MYQLSGVASGPPVRRSSIVPRLAVLVIVWIILAVGYSLYRLYRPPDQAVARAEVKTETEIRAQASPGTPTVQDCARHIEEANAIIARAQTHLRNTEDRLRRLLFESDSTRRARSLARGLDDIEAARQDLSASRQELEFIHSILKGDSNQ